jgi:hypothetical protein
MIGAIIELTDEPIPRLEPLEPLEPPDILKVCIAIMGIMSFIMSLNSAAEDEFELLLALLNFCIIIVINCI